MAIDNYNILFVTSGELSLFESKQQMYRAFRNAFNVVDCNATLYYTHEVSDIATLKKDIISEIDSLQLKAVIVYNPGITSANVKDALVEIIHYCEDKGIYVAIMDEVAGSIDLTSISDPSNRFTARCWFDYPGTQLAKEDVEETVRAVAAACIKPKRPLPNEAPAPTATPH